MEMNMDKDENKGVGRRSFVATWAAIISGLFLPKKGQGKEVFAQLKHVLSRMEIETLQRSKPTRTPDMVWKSVDETTTFYQREKENSQPLFSTNPVGQTIWEGCTGENSPRDLSLLVQRKFQVTPEQAYIDCLVFLNELKKKGAILV